MPSRSDDVDIKSGGRESTGKTEMKVRFEASLRICEDGQRHCMAAAPDYNERIKENSKTLEIICGIDK